MAQRGQLPAWDPKAGDRVWLPPEELAKRYAAGQVQLIAGQQYDMVGPDGEDVRVVPDSDVNEHLHHGFTFATAQQSAHAEVANDPAAAYKAFGDGIVNSALWGAGDAMRVQSGTGDPELIKERARQHQVARVFGDVTGAVAGAAAAGALGPGALAESGASSLLGREAAGTIAGRALIGTAGGAAEGAVRGFGGAVDEAVLGDGNLSAQRIIAHAGLGALFGGAVGGVFGGIAGLRARAVDAEALRAAATGEPAPSGFGALLNRVAGKVAGMGSGDEDLLRQAYHSDPAVREAFFSRLAGRDEAVDAASRAVRDALQEHVDAIGAIRPSSEAGGELFARGLGRIEQRFMRDGAVDAAKVDGFVRGLTRPKGDGNLQALEGFLEDSNLLLQSERAAGLGPEGATLGAPALARIAKAFESDRALRDALKGAEDNVAFRNAVVKQLSAEAGHHAGGLLPYGVAALEAVNHPVIAGLALAGKAGVAMVGHPLGLAMRMQGLIRVLNGVSAHIDSGMEAFVAGTKPIATAMPRVISPATQAGLDAAGPEERRRAYGDRIRELQAMADPTVAANALGAGTAQLGEHAPVTAGLVSTVGGNAHATLLRMVPQPLVERTPFDGAEHARNPLSMVSDSDIRTFNHVDAALQDPLRVVDQMAAGTMPHPQALAAVQATYPELWGAVRDSFLRQVSESRTSMSHGRRTIASIAFGIAADPALAPGALGRHQAVASAGAQPASASPRGGRRGGRPNTPAGVRAELESFGMTKLDRLLSK